MAEVVVRKGDDGKLVGMGAAGERAWGRFRAMVDRLAPGDTLKFAFWEPRSPGFHRLFFAKLHQLFEMQEQFEDEDKLRAWLTVGAGEADYFPGPKGRTVAIPRSIAWEKLDEASFRELVARIDNFLWTDHARSFLWPHLAPLKTYEAIEQLQTSFSR